MKRKGVLQIATAAITAGALSLVTMGAAYGADSYETEALVSDHITSFENDLQQVHFVTGQIDEAEVDAAFLAILEGQKEAGKLSYKVQKDGSFLFFTTVNISQADSVEFIYELPKGSLQAQELTNGAIYEQYSYRSGGDEWYPKIWAGKDGKGTWVRFNKSAQGLMYSAAGTALKVAICAIPGVNAVGCSVVWGATLIAKRVMKDIGRCPSSRPWLYVYPAAMEGMCRS